MSAASDLSAKETACARAALNFLRVRCGHWSVVGRALRLSKTGLAHAAAGRRPISPTVIFRIAKFAKVGVDDVLTGRFPAPGTCPHCGHVKSEADQ